MIVLIIVAAILVIMGVVILIGKDDCYPAVTPKITIIRDFTDGLFRVPLPSIS